MTVNRSGSQYDSRIVAEFNKIITHLVTENNLSVLILELIRNPELLIGEISPGKDIRAP